VRRKATFLTQDQTNARDLSEFNGDYLSGGASTISSIVESTFVSGTRSPKETTPTGVLSASTTGSRRTDSCSMRLIASSRLSKGETVAGLSLHTSAKVTSPRFGLSAKPG
jgi:hypothetical protein